MIIKKQSLEEMKKIYDGMMKDHFPADEIKPFWVIEKGYQAERYMGYGLYHEEHPEVCLAYAWMCWMKEENWILLDYYAVREDLRGQGLGSVFLQKVLKEHTREMPVIIEVEDPDRIEMEEEIGKTEVEKQGSLRREKEKRLRRIAFYRKNGIRMTDMRATVYRVPYAIMIFQQNFDDGFDRESLKRAYRIFYAHIPDYVEIW